MQKIQNMILPNIGYLMAELTDEEFLPILKEVKNIRNNMQKANPLNYGLVGHIRHEYQLLDSHEHISQLVLPLINKFDVEQKGRQNIKYKSHVPWVNFQKKTEFNPPHTHNGAYSYVVWVSVPYDINDEKNIMPLVPQRANVVGTFNFHYIDILGNLIHHSLPVDKTWEKRLIVFPAELNHSVNPFYTSNEYRISVAGNFEELK
jgi:hypothetical protein